MRIVVALLALAGPMADAEVTILTAAASLGREQESEVTRPRPPRHVAIIMDGNGRWANDRGLPRLKGHERGAESVRAVTEECVAVAAQPVGVTFDRVTVTPAEPP